MKKNTNEKDKKKAKSKSKAMTKKDKKKGDAPAPSSPVANCQRKSLFAAQRDGRSEKRVSTFALPILSLLLIVVVPVLIKPIFDIIVNACNVAAADLSITLTNLFEGVKLIESIVVEIDAYSIINSAISAIILADLGWWAVLKKGEKERIEEADKIRYYFYSDIIEFCKEEKRESFRAIGGIVSVKVTPAVNEDLGPTLMTAIVALLSRNSKPLWQRKHGFRDVTIVPLGNPSETIVLHDVKNPSELVNNIKLHYPQCHVESYGNSFNI